VRASASVGLATVPNFNHIVGPLPAVGVQAESSVVSHATAMKVSQRKRGDVDSVPERPLSPQGTQVVRPVDQFFLLAQAMLPY
jgi:hypothetical protein